MNENNEKNQRSTPVTLKSFKVTKIQKSDRNSSCENIPFFNAQLRQINAMDDCIYVKSTCKDVWALCLNDHHIRWMVTQLII